jgi:hypothetical protein
MSHTPFRAFALAVIGFAAATTQGSSQQDLGYTCVAQCTNTDQWCATTYGGYSYQYDSWCDDIFACLEDRPNSLFCHRL